MNIARQRGAVGGVVVVIVQRIVGLDSCCNRESANPNDGPS